MAAIANEMVMAGPVCSAATMPVMENRPAPMITPTPKAISPKGPSTRRSVPPPSRSASANNVFRGFLIKSPIFLIFSADKGSARRVENKAKTTFSAFYPEPKPTWGEAKFTEAS